MAQKSLRAQSLGGQARNPVVGQVEKDLVPDRVFNLVPNRIGGFTPFGYRAAVREDLNDPSSAQVEIPHVRDGLIGADETGISSYNPPATGGGVDI